jgi:hypothetical protein
MAALVKNLYCDSYTPKVGNKVSYDGREGIVESITYNIDLADGNKISVECVPGSKNFINITAIENREAEYRNSRNINTRGGKKRNRRSKKYRK